MMPPFGVLEIPRFRKDMRDAGAVSPETARPESELPESVRADLDRLMSAGIVREGSFGTYYLHEATASAAMWILLLKAVSFWFLVIIIPVVILQLSRSPGSP
jgi:hypothetical protein